MSSQDLAAECEQKIPRPCNSWMLFRADATKNMGRYLVNWVPETGKKEREQDKSLILSEIWRGSPDLRAHFASLAKEEKIRHAEKYPGYKFRPKKAGERKKRKTATKNQDEDGLSLRRSHRVDGSANMVSLEGRSQQGAPYHIPHSSRNDSNSPHSTGLISMYSPDYSTTSTPSASSTSSRCATGSPSAIIPMALPKPASMTSPDPLPYPLLPSYYEYFNDQEPAHSSGNATSPEIFEASVPPSPGQSDFGPHHYEELSSSPNEYSTPESYDFPLFEPAIPPIYPQESRLSAGNQLYASHNHDNTPGSFVDEGSSYWCQIIPTNSLEERATEIASYSANEAYTQDAQSDHAIDPSLLRSPVEVSIGTHQYFAMDSYITGSVTSYQGGRNGQ